MQATLSQFWTQYARLGLLAGGVMAALSVTLLLVPGLIHWLFQIDSSTGTDVMSGRAAMLFAGLAVITLQTRNAPAGPQRQSISLGIAVTMGGLACVGLYDFLRGAVGLGIWLAILAELFFVTAYMRFWRIG
jgi:hypothetical protein